MQRGPQHPRFDHATRRSALQRARRRAGPRRASTTTSTTCARSSAASSGRKRSNAERVIRIDAPVGVPESFEEHVGADVRPAGGGVPGRPHARLHVHDGARGQPAHLSRSLGIRQPHHDVSHHGSQPEKMAQHAKVNTHYASAVRRRSSRSSQATPEGDGTVLDHSLIVYGGGMSDGQAHSPYPLPLAAVGGAGGRVEGQPPHRGARVDAGGEPLAGRGEHVRQSDREVRREQRRAWSCDDADDDGLRCAPGSVLALVATCGGVGRCRRDALVDAVKSRRSAAVRALLASARRRAGRRGRRHDGAALGRARRRRRDSSACCCDAGADADGGQPLRRHAAAAGRGERRRGYR